MARRFRGEHTQKVDGKGRVSIPAGFRKVIEANDPDWVEGRAAALIVVSGNETRKFLECYTVRAAEEVDTLIERMPRGSPERRVMEDFFHSKSDEVAVDGTGRLVLPKKLRDKIGLTGEGEVVFNASGDTFQIWKAETYATDHEAGLREAYARLGEADPLTLLDAYRER